MPTLVRHAAVVVDPAVPASEWRLSDEGRAAARSLMLVGDAGAVTSPEPKAAETAALAGLEARVDERLREVARPWSGDYVTEVRRWFAGVELPGWERREDALERLHAALDGFTGVAVSHGLAISLYAGLSFDEWRMLPFPAVVRC